MRGAQGQGLGHTIRKGQFVLLSFVVFMAALSLYWGTLLPGVLPADAGEFQLVAREAGVAHPPGYPLYTMLGWLFTRLPIGPTPAWRLNLFSAVTGAATLTLVFATARRLTNSTLGGLVATLTLGSATTFWATATGASIRPLTAFFTALSLCALTRHASRVGSEGSSDSRGVKRGRRDRYLVLFFLALSLGLTHHPSLAFPAVVFAAYLVLVDPALLRQPRRWVKPAVAIVPGLVVLIYLPLRGGSDLATLSGFLEHVLARGFRGDMFALNLFDRLVLLPTLLRFQFNGVLIFGMLTGAIFLLWRDRKLAFLLVGSFLVHTAVTLTYDAPQTVEYEMPAYVCLALLIAIPFGELSTVRGAVDGSRSTPRRIQSLASYASYVLAVVFLIAGGANLVAHLPSYRTLSGSHEAREYVEKVLNGAPRDAVILSNWHWVTPLRYLRQVEEIRPDVAIEYVAPRGEPLERTWVRRIEEHIEQRPVIVLRYFETAYGALPYTFEPLGEAFVVRRTPRTAMPVDMRPLDVTLGEQIRLLGYRLEKEDAEPAQPLTLALAWKPMSELTEDVALFGHLIGVDGRLWSSAQDPRHSAERVALEEVVLDHFVIYPFLHAAPGDYALTVGAYASGGRFATSDGADVVRLGTVSLHASTARPVTEHMRFIRFSGGPTLIGVDHDVSAEGQVRTYLHWAGPGKSAGVQLTSTNDALLTPAQVPALERGEYATMAVDRPMAPTRLTLLGEDGVRRWNLVFQTPVRLPPPKPGERYVPLGGAMVLTGFDAPSTGLDPGTGAALPLRFRSQGPVERDYIVSAALTGLNADGTWSWRAAHDTVPALGAIPTLKWIWNSTVLDPHRMTIPIDAADVPVVGSFLVYDHFTQRLLLPLDARLDPAVKLGTWDVVSE